MQIIDYFAQEHLAPWLTQIKACDWGAGKYLTHLLESGTFHQVLGAGSTLLLAAEGDKLLAFATYAVRDCIDDPALTPWVGFVYTYPAHRGRRLSGFLIEYIAAAAYRDGHADLYVATDHVGLYEKYGFTFLENRPSIYGEMSRVLKRNLLPIPKGGDENAE